MIVLRYHVRFQKNTVRTRTGTSTVVFIYVGRRSTVVTGATKYNWVQYVFLFTTGGNAKRLKPFIASNIAGFFEGGSPVNIHWTICNWSKPWVSCCLTWVSFFFFWGVLSKVTRKSRLLTWVFTKIDKNLSFFDPVFFFKVHKKSLV